MRSGANHRTPGESHGSKRNRRTERYREPIRQSVRRKKCCAEGSQAQGQEKSCQEGCQEKKAVASIRSYCCEKCSSFRRAWSKFATRKTFQPPIRGTWFRCRFVSVRCGGPRSPCLFPPTSGSDQPHRWAA